MARAADHSDDMHQLALLSRRMRFELVRLSHMTRTMHLASSLSCVDVLLSLYSGVMTIHPENPLAPNRDRFILSKGHAANALYAVLAERGFFERELLCRIGRPGSILPEHPDLHATVGIEATTGSLGHGLALGIGMALASKLIGEHYRVFVLLSDGECNEGSTWEGAMFAPIRALGNLCAIVDYNKWQATGRSAEITKLEPLSEKWRTFGWRVYEVDGHNHRELLDAFERIKVEREMPSVVIAHTVKGKGVSFMEDDNNWHYRIPTENEVELARKELLEVG